MFPGAKVVAIDDDGPDLNVIIQAFKVLGLACLSYHFPDERPADGVSFSGIRIFVTDINLLGGTSPGNEAGTLAPVVSLIDRIIAPENGPYALITWSTTDLHDALVARIKATGKLANRQPFFSMCLAKTQFLQNPPLLIEAIKRIFQDNAPFGALLDWERRVSRAGEKVLSDIDGFSKKFSGNDPAQKMNRMLSRLAVDAFGRSHVEAHRFESVNEALLPILTDALGSEFASDSSTSLWERAVTMHTEKNEIEPAVAAQLNSAANFETLPNIKPYRRGAVLALPAAWHKDDVFEARFGAKSSELRDKLLKLTKPEELIWVLIQAQAACDFAQPRIGPIPYFLAAVVPNNHEPAKRSLPRSVWRTPLLAPAPGLSDVAFRFEVMHGITPQLTKPLMNFWKFKVLGRLKDQIVSSIAYEHHSHGSRPGFISFGL